MAKGKNKIGYFSFIIGGILAVIFGLIITVPRISAKFGPKTQMWIYSLLILLGIVVGLFNITGKETKEYLFTALVLILIAQFGGMTVLGQVYKVGPYLEGVFFSFLVFVVPAVVVVAVKNILNLSKD